MEPGNTMKMDGGIQVNEVTRRGEQETEAMVKVFLYIYLPKSSPFLSVIHSRPDRTQL